MAFDARRAISLGIGTVALAAVLLIACQPPLRVTIASPAHGSFTTAGSVTATGSVTGVTSVNASLIVNGIAVPVGLPMARGAPACCSTLNASSSRSWPTSRTLRPASAFAIAW